jgi:uncharacterized membrane protein YdjX (TVP38/TMEM64 family)
LIKLSKPRTQFCMLVLLMAVLIGIGFLFDFDQEKWANYFSRVPFPVAGTLYVAAYVCVTTLVWMSKDLLRIVGAIVFGPYWSTLFIWIGELANAVIFFHLSRRLGRAYVEEKFNLKKGKLDNDGRRSGVWHIFLPRAFPFIPFRILDLAYGMTAVSLLKYLVVSAFAIPVRIFWVQFFIAAFFIDGKLDIQGGMNYFMQHMSIVWLSFLYMIVSFAAVVLLRRRLK